MRFFNVKTRSSVEVPDNQVQTQKFERTTKSGKKQVRYALTATSGGQKLFKFVDQATYQKFGGK